MTTRTFRRSGHGTGRGRDRVENPRDELSEGTAAPTAAVSGEDRPLARNAHGQFADRQAASEAAKRSAAARARNRQLSTGMEVPRTMRIGTGMGHLFELRANAVRFAEMKDRVYREKRIEMARDVGNGFCGVGASASLKQWAHAHIDSLMCFELASGPLGAVRIGPAPDGPNKQQTISVKVQAELLATATRLSAEARQCLLTAHSLCAEEAKARAARSEAGVGNDAPTGFAFIAEENES